MSFFKKFVGDRVLYNRIFMLMVPIMIQNGITNLVNMLDNIMVGRVGTYEMVGVAIVNQLFFVLNLCIFGAVSGAGIFGAQFYGNNDTKGVRDTFRFKLVFCVAISAVFVAALLVFQDDLIMLYLKGEGEKTDIAYSLASAKKYLKIMVVGILPYAITQCYSSTLRECDSPKLPMVAGIIAVFVNMVLNYVLIFGKFGAPKLGVKGAAIATVVSRFVELAVISVWTAKKSDKNQFIVGAFKSFKIPKNLASGIFLKGLPLMLNESMWSFGIAFLNQIYSRKSIDVVAANNISQTFFNVFSTAFLAVGAAIGIILGQMLGAGEYKKAKDDSKKLIAFAVAISVLVGGLFAAFSGVIPLMYNTTKNVRTLATVLMLITAIAMPIDALANSLYFTLRSGGQVIITFLFDSCFVWIVSIPTAIFLCGLDSVSIVALYSIIQFMNIIKCVIGIIFVKKGSWIKNIVL